MFQASHLLAETATTKPVLSADVDNDATTPPLEEVTVCSSFVDDDDASSVSSVASEDMVVRPRSIFKEYWQMSGSRTSLPSKISSAPCSQINVSVLDLDEDNTSVNIYELTLKHQEAPTPPRRRIFGQGCWSNSSPTLSMNALRHPIRKTKSATILQKPSCLKPSRYSGQVCGDHSTSESSVSFKEHVDIRVFPRPMESFAEDGWSSWFA